MTDSKMRAARYYGKGDIRVEDVPIPKVGPKQFLVEIEWCGICGSDLHEYIMGTRTLLFVLFARCVTNAMKRQKQKMSVY